jgi:hypothetical protein
VIGTLKKLSLSPRAKKVMLDMAATLVKSLQDWDNKPAKLK